jgi:hypothetical protein
VKGTKGLVPRDMGCGRPLKATEDPHPSHAGLPKIGSMKNVNECNKNISSPFLVCKLHKENTARSQSK